jgi:uncharacterized SAM-binding protein YcdF (DUF218 family)
VESWQQIVELFLLPPGSVIAIAILGFFIYGKWKWLGICIVGLSVALLVALSLPLTGRELTSGLEASASPLYVDALEDAKKQAGAIVVLGAGRYADAPEYGADTVSRFALERLRYAARLHQQTGLPILVAGGSPGGEKTPEATLMRDALQRDFRITPRWVEVRSRNTMENAVSAAELLKASGINHVILVTHAWHMQRAEWAFKAAGLRVTPAPTGFNTLSERERRLIGYLPSAKGLYWTSMALRERLGYLWYRWRYPPEELPGIEHALNAPGKSNPAGGK